MLLGQLKCFKCLLFGELGRGLFSAFLVGKFSLLGGHQHLLELRVLCHDLHRHGELSLGCIKLCHQFLEHSLSHLVILTELLLDELAVLSILALFMKFKTALEGFIPVGLATLAACQSDEIEKSEEILRVEHLAIRSLLDLVKSGSFELFSNIRTAGATIFGAEEVVEEGSTDKCTSGSNSEEETLVVVLSFDHFYPNI